MKRRRLLALICALTSAAAPAQERTFVLSVEGIRLGANEYVDGFTIDTWAVRPIAVCRIPPGWTIRAGRRASPDGVISGEASHGVTFLPAAHLSQLRALVLIRLAAGAEPKERLEGSNEPAMFDGRVEIGTYGTEPSARMARLTRANIDLTPARRCPDPQR